MAKKIQASFALKNNFSPTIFKIKKDMQGLTGEMKTAQRTAIIMADKFKKSLDQTINKMAKFAVTGAGIVGALALKTGFSEAFNLEGYRTQLETATKDTKRAAEVMKYSISLANKTPFEGGELVEAASKLEMFQLKTERWLPVLGDAAAGVNKSMADIQEGFIKAVTIGDFQSLRDTLGMTKEMVDAFAVKNLGGSFLNAKGTVIDTKKLQDALEGLMNERYSGGMEKLATTSKGLWSTITGVTKNSLANIVGMQNDGTVKSGSMLALLKEKITSVADTLTKWQADGTIERLSDSFSKGFTAIYDTVSKLFEFISKNKQKIEFAGTLLLGAVAGMKLAGAVSILVKGFQQFKLVMTGMQVLSLGFSGWGILIGVVVAGILLIVKNWDKIAPALQKTWETVKTIFAPMFEWLGGMWEKVIGFVKGLGEGIAKIFGGIFDFALGMIKKRLNFFISIINTVTGFLNNFKFTIPEWSPIGAGQSIGFNIPKIPEFAMGTQYSPQGLARINERGGEIVNLPSGAKVIPADKSKKQLGGTQVIVNVTVQGNLIGNAEYANYIGDIVGNKLVVALDKI